MKLWIKDSNGWQDVTQLVEGSVSWTGDKKQMARALEFNILVTETDAVKPQFVPLAGMRVMFFDENDELVFGGRIMGRDFAKTSTSMRCKALDDGQYLRNKVTYKFSNILVEDATKKILKDLKLTVGDIAATGIKTSQTHMNKTAYDVIMSLYTKAHGGTKKAYGVQVDPLLGICVNALGEDMYEFVLDGGILFDASVSETAENLVNVVLKVDDKGKVLSEQRKDTLIAVFGRFQEMVDAKATKAEIEKAFKEVETTYNVQIPGDSRLIAGSAVTVRDNFTKMVGVFYVDSDAHEFKETGHMLRMTLTLENLMDEKEYEEQKAAAAKKKGSGKRKKKATSSSAKPSGNGANSDAENEYAKWLREYGSRIPDHDPDTDVPPSSSNNGSSWSGNNPPPTGGGGGGGGSWGDETPSGGGGGGGGGW